MRKLIVLDTNILIRAVLAERVPNLLDKYNYNCSFVTPASCYDELNEHLPKILQKRDLPLDPFLSAMEKLTKVVIPIAEEIYSEYEYDAKRRIQKRDIKDWTTVALALSLSCPIWTEDQDFFGIGIATWNTQNVEIYLGSN
ncbi:nucleotide-binding protein [Anabaena sp. FACHB-1237]|uniref:PIN domain-containing protein n=1 Tax=Anabaena sp. FACHB-1237 TaxID=2692769 RepID=UPI0016808C2F|nr:PIN domain-containing protein [Anabaena sp. FACHB-1237]MBD2136310.1 nucleotide-binding protein [Anabaena sp. FACHB-1237]